MLAPMTPSFRYKLPWLIAACWLWGSWYWILGAPSLQKMLYFGFGEEVAARVSEFQAVGWATMLLVTMLVADRLFCRFADWRWGVDPMAVHWSKLRNRDGRFLCAACLSPFMLPPEDLSDEGWVHCGDCGHAVAPYGEMKRHVDPEAELARWAGALLGPRR